MSIYKTEDGKYYFRVYYTDLFGERKQRKSKRYNTKKECVQAETQFKIDSSEATIHSITFEDLALNYIEYSSKNNTPKTKKDKLMMVKNYTSCINKKDVTKITPATMKRFREQLDELKLSTSRKNRALGFCDSVFKHGMKFYGLQSNPLALVDRFRTSSEERMKEMSVYTPKEFDAFLNAIKPCHKDYYNLYFVLYWTGLRLNEAMSLTFNDYDHKFIYVTKQWIDGKWCPLKTKGSKRKVAIDQDIYDVLQEQYNKYKDYAAFSKDWFVFGGYVHFNQTSVTRIKNNACKDSGLPQIRLHDFRHSHASNLIESGVNMYKISKRLGHSSVTITMDRYGHLIDEEGDEILNAMRVKKQ